MTKQNLYMIHCGFYDEEISSGVYEFHVNIPIAASSLEEAKQQVRKDENFVQRKMHIDGMQHISFASGYRVELVPGLSGRSIEAEAQSYRDFE